MSSLRRVVIKSEDERLVYGEVYAPLQVDVDDEAMTHEEIRKMAHNFLMSGRVNKIDVTHSYEESGCLVVESFIARKSDPDGFIEGAWVLGVKILPDELWKAVKKGELNGFSFGGDTETRTVLATVEVAKQIVGHTEKSDDDGLLPPHEHDIDIKFDEEGHVISGKTSKKLGHEHPVLRTTATELVLEHAHRMILIDNK